MGTRNCGMLTHVSAKLKFQKKKIVLSTYFIEITDLHHMRRNLIRHVILSTIG